LHDLTYTLWDGECATCGRYQLDHFLASKELVPYLSGASTESLNGSDHKSLVVTLNV
jgi:hypothetical protein